MKITLNPNAELVAQIRRQLQSNGGYCPCMLQQTPDTKCMCKSFRTQIADPTFAGECHCGLYVKEI